MSTSVRDLNRANWLILGGCGFIGQNLLLYLHINKLAASITVADIKPPDRAFVPKELQLLFDTKKITFVHSDLCQSAHVDRLFPADKQYDYVVNLVAESRTGFTNEQIHTKMTQSFTLVIDKLESLGENGKFKPFLIEMSTAQIYDPTGKPLNEISTVKPWTTAAKAKLECENYLKRKLRVERGGANVRACILRPSTVYGPGDLTGLSPRLCCAAVYQKTKETMDFLWTKNLAVNTVHVLDVCRAIEWVAKYQDWFNNVTMNLSDQGNTTQDTINSAIEEIFSIKTGFVGTIMSNIAKLRLEDATTQSNEYHYPLWLELVRQSGIQNTPLTTYLRTELLYNNPLCIDGTNITHFPVGKKHEMFTYKYPQCTPTLIYQTLLFAQNNNTWPRTVTLTQPLERKKK